MTDRLLANLQTDGSTTAANGELQRLEGPNRPDTAGPTLGRTTIELAAVMSKQCLGGYPGSKKAPTERWEPMSKVSDQTADLAILVGDTGIEPVTSPV